MIETISQHGFTWENVADIFPAQNFVDELSRTGVLNGAKFQNAYFTNTETDPEVSHVQVICIKGSGLVLIWGIYVESKACIRSKAT